MSSAELFVRKFRRYPFWTQLLLTLGALVLLIAIWTACGLPSYSPDSFPPPRLARPDAEFRAHNGAVLALAFGPAGTLIAAGTGDTLVRVWDVSKREIIHTLKGHRGTVTCLAVSPDGSILATGSADKTVKLWDVSKEMELRTLAGHSGQVTSVAFSPDGRWLASAGDDQAIRIWSASSGELVRSLEGHTGIINTLTFSPDNRMLASGSDDRTIRLWEPATGNLVRSLFAHNSRILSVAFSPDGKVLASGGAAQVQLIPSSRTTQLKLWDPQTGNEEHTFEVVLGDVRSLAFRADNRILAFASGISEVFQVIYLDVATRRTIKAWNADHAPINALAFSPDGKWLASGGGDGRIRLWR